MLMGIETLASLKKLAIPNARRAHSVKLKAQGSKLKAEGSKKNKSVSSCFNGPLEALFNLILPNFIVGLARV